MRRHEQKFQIKNKNKKLLTQNDHHWGFSS